MMRPLMYRPFRTLIQQNNLPGALPQARSLSENSKINDSAKTNSLFINVLKNWFFEKLNSWTAS
ncbi:Uncharacterised protein [Candidatus Venteria ishoeyi]|uniref:Uncharacterized protein n=1 Tax=Candidatus Venteria ishoeyi TaxID=1899563 RepID=A0A1H6FC02_9GAMM|nr:Uncharacterised protein [Candidatus Venteria ishoeyi]